MRQSAVRVRDRMWGSMCGFIGNMAGDTASMSGVIEGGSEGERKLVKREKANVLRTYEVRFGSKVAIVECGMKSGMEHHASSRNLCASATKEDRGFGRVRLQCECLHTVGQKSLRIGLLTV